MLDLYPESKDEEKNALIEPIYKRMDSNYSYSKEATFTCLKEVLKFKKEKKIKKSEKQALNNKKF